MKPNETSDTHLTREMLSSIVEFFEAEQQLGNVKFYGMLSEKLSKIVRKDPPWTWRYSQGVHKGTVQPSKLFSQAVLALGAALDEVSAALAYTVEVRVFARPGQVQPNSLILGQSKPCARPGCRVMHVPRVPWGKYCSPDCSALAIDEKKQRRKKQEVKE